MINKVLNTDLMYKQALIRGIQQKYQFTPNVEALNSVLAPSELKTLLLSIPSRFFETGNPLRDLFENIKNCVYRVNLHIHTNKSDGSMTPVEYLEQSLRYANKVAKRVNDKFPSYISATTDHNNFEAAQEVIAMIADEPGKYKNFRFVAGCEFMFLDKNCGFEFPAFEAVGLGINPFSEELSKKIGAFNSINIIKKIKEFGAVLSYAHPARFCQGNGQTPEFINYLMKIGVDGIESNYQYIGFKIFPELIQQIKESKQIALRNSLVETGGTDTHGKNIFHSKAENILDLLL